MENVTALPAAVPLLLMIKPITNCSDKFFFLLTSCFKQLFYLVFLLHSPTFRPLKSLRQELVKCRHSMDLLNSHPQNGFFSSEEKTVMLKVTFMLNFWWHSTVDCVWVGKSLSQMRVDCKFNMHIPTCVHTATIFNG